MSWCKFRAFVQQEWTEADIASFMETIAPVGYPAKTLATILVEECNKLYKGKPIDDATACILRVIKRAQVNLLFGPPANREDCDRMMSLFFSKAGKHIICGGTTAQSQLTTWVSQSKLTE